MTQNWNANKEIYVPAPTHSNSATRKAYVDYHINNQINGDRHFHNNKITSLKAGTNDTDSINKKQLDDGLSSKANTSELLKYVKKDGSISMTGNLNLGNKQITNLGYNINNASDVVYMGFCDQKYFQNTAIKNLDMDNNKIIDLAPGTSQRDAINKKQLDDDLLNYVKKMDLFQ